MTKNTTLIMIFGLYLFFNVDLAMADTIELKDNRVIKVDCYWEKDGKVFYERHGTVVSFEKSQIKKISDESGPAPKIVYRDESAENKNDLIQIQKKEYTVKSHEEQIAEGLLVKNKESFPPKHDFESNGTRYKYIRPGVYQTENGNFYKTTGVSGANDKRFPPKKYFESNGKCYEIISPGVYEERSQGRCP